jgi:hypothetical protein
MSKLSKLLNVKEGQEFKYTKLHGTYRVKGEYLEYKDVRDEWHILTGIGIYIILEDLDGIITFISEDIQLTDQQITSIKGRIAEGTPWAARNRKGILFFYENKPKLSYDQIYFYSEEYKVLAQFKSDLYDFITFENSPVYLPDLLKNKN